MRLSRLGEASRAARDLFRRNGSYTGYQVVGADRVELPAGSKLDAQAGIFYWEPGAGFAGSFELIFEPLASATGEAGGQSVRLIVTLR